MTPKPLDFNSIFDRVGRFSSLLAGLFFRFSDMPAKLNSLSGRLIECTGMEEYRTEKDSMGEVAVPATAYYGAQTQRAVVNFEVSELRFPRPFIRALGLIKKAAAETNLELELLEPGPGEAIFQAADEVASGQFDDHFPLDVFQTGSGTSTNMNANEVIANRAIEVAGGQVGDGSIHPNDHVNLGQSSNDVIPTAIHVSALEQMERKLLPALQHLKSALQSKAEKFDDVVKIGRTHLQDAVPIRLGQEFSGYARMVEQAAARVAGTFDSLSELAIGGTAVGTGLNCPEGFPEKVVEKLNEWTDLEFRESENRFEALATKDAAVEASASLRGAAVSLMKIANDIRWLGSGPRCGIGEIVLPPTQPGSSIMPGKVNPVIAESVTMVAAQVMGNDLTIAVAGQSGSFELNVMMPVIAYNLLQSIDLLSNASVMFADKCIRGIEADRERCGEMVEKSLAMVTALAPLIGYEQAAEIAGEAHTTGESVRVVARRRSGLSKAELEEALDPIRQTGD